MLTTAELILFAIPIAGDSSKFTVVASSKPPAPLLLSGSLPASEMSLTLAPLGLSPLPVALLL